MAIKNLNSIAERLIGVQFDGEEITPDKLIELINSEDSHELQVSEVSVLTDEGLEDLKSNLKKGGYNEGKVAGEEMATKKIKELLGVEVEGRDFAKIAESVKEQLTKEAKLPVDKKVQELNESLENLRKTMETEKQTYESQINDYKSKFEQQRKDSFLSSKLPKIEGMKPNHLLAAMKADGIDVQFDEDGNVIPLKAGKAVKDKYEKVVNFEAVINDWVTENGYQTGAPGRGGQGDPNGKPAGSFESINDVFKWAESEGIQPTDERFEKAAAPFLDK